MNIISSGQDCVMKWEVQPKLQHSFQEGEPQFLQSHHRNCDEVPHIKVRL